MELEFLSLVDAGLMALAGQSFAGYEDELAKAHAAGPEQEKTWIAQQQALMQKKAELEQAVKHARGEAEQLQAKWRDLEAKGADGVTLFYWEGRAERAAALYKALAQQWN